MRLTVPCREMFRASAVHYTGRPPRRQPTAALPRCPAAPAGPVHAPQPGLCRPTYLGNECRRQLWGGAAWGCHTTTPHALPVPFVQGRVIPRPWEIIPIRRRQVAAGWVSTAGTACSVRRPPRSRCTRRRTDCLGRMRPPRQIRLLCGWPPISFPPARTTACAGSVP